jgi:hypothetical protein
MSQDSLELLVRNIDERLLRVEQILPTLATKEDLRNEVRNLATKDELRDLATKDELRNLATKDELRNLATKDELRNLATKDELRNLATKDELRVESNRTRRHFDVVAERLEGHIRLLAEGQVALREQMDRRFDGVTKELGQLDRRVMRLEAGPPRR